MNTGAVNGNPNDITNDIPKTVVHMFDLARVKNAEVHKEDVQKAIDVTTALI